jgi:lysozyme
VSSDDLKKRLPPALKQAIALEAAVWRKYFSSGTTPTTGARTDSATPLPVTPEAKGEEEAKLPARPEANRAAFHQPPTLEISEAGLNLIREYESFFAKPYYCCANKLTVGYGCRLVKAIKLVRSQKGGLSKTDAECFLKEDVNLHERLVQKHFANIPLTQGMYDALVSWSFNTGALETFESNSKKQPTLHKLLEQGDYRKGLRELLKWVDYTRNGKKHVARGLARRRAAEYRLAMNGFKENAVPKQGLTEQAPNRKPEPNRQG